MTTYNFSAGPAVLPSEVIQEIQRDLPSINNTGMSILEVSHRGPDFVRILEEAKDNLRHLMSIPDNYEVLFMQGGGTGQFAAVPLNLAQNHHRIALLDSGHWASAAGKEATELRFEVDVVASTKDVGYTNLPKLPENYVGKDVDYLHITTNNTIEGTAYHQVPMLDDDQLLVADMSSNFLAEPYNVADFGLIFAGAQKNVGPAGVTVVIVRKDLLQPVHGIPSVLNYEKTAAKNSMLNTPPVFSIYAANLVLRWLIDQGGINAIHQKNLAKADLLYTYLDKSTLFHNRIAKSDRSLTNITFTTNSANLDLEVAAAAAAAGLLNLKGHRSVGGLRASLYNAMPTEGVNALVAFLTQFEATHKE